MNIKLIKENNIGKTCQTDKFKILYRKKGSISGDNSINPKELIYFITGSAKITLKNESWNITSPDIVKIPAKTYHKIEAITDISFVLF